jgi:hypothetical protein
MKNLLVFFVSLCLLQSCEVKRGSGNIEKQERKTGEFSKVDVGGSIEVIIRRGDRSKVTVEADDNILEDIETSVSGGELTIEFGDRVSVSTAHVKVYVETPGLTGINASASSSVSVEGVLSSDKKIHFEASSSANIQAEIDAPAAELDASSSGKIVLKGRTKDLRAEASSAGSIEAAELLSENARAEASSGASIQIHASLKLDAEANSGGSVSYRGEPTLTKEENSGGSVSKLN